MAMTKFRSKHFPGSDKRIVLVQEYAMQYYATFALIVMLGVLVKVYVGQSVLWFGIIGMGLSIVLGNMLAYVRLKKSIAEIFFVQDHFSLISVYEILFGAENTAFPLRYANAQRTAEGISLHFNDQVINLKREDWEDFDLIWDWLTQTQTL